MKDKTFVDVFNEVMFCGHSVVDDSDQFDMFFEEKMNPYTWRVGNDTQVGIKEEERLKLLGDLDERP